MEFLFIIKAPGIKKKIILSACYLQLAFFQLSQVVEACCKFLMKQLHPSNCLGIRSFADAQGCTDLHKVAHNYTMVCIFLKAGKALISLPYFFIVAGSSACCCFPMALLLYVLRFRLSCLVCHIFTDV